jgi:arylsulfatase A-like enzyme
MPYHTAPEEHRTHYADMDVEAHCKRYPNIPPKGTKWGDYYRKHIKGYYAQMTGVDYEFGRVLKCLEDEGLADNTIVIFTSDHGDCLGRHNEISKNNHYQESMGIPFMIRWPGHIKPRIDDLLLSVPDLAPTMLSLAGLKDRIPDYIEGTDFAGLMRTGKGKRPTSQLFCRHGYYNDGPSHGERGVRTHTHTMVLEQNRPGDNMKVTLHDNIKDPCQLVNIADQHPDLVTRLCEEELRPWLELQNDPWLSKATPFPNKTRSPSR